MQLGQIKSISYKIPCRIEAGNETIEFVLDPLPIDFYSRISGQLPEPQPPLKGFAKDSGGRLIRDERGNAIPEYNFADQKYVAAQAENAQLQNVALVYEALKSSANFLTNREKFDTWHDFYAAIQKELSEFGFTFSHLAQILGALRSDNRVQDEIASEKKR